MSDRWIVIRNWERFQHPDAARSQVPPWIKFWTQLLSDDSYMALTEHRRLMFCQLLLAYASSRRRLLLDTASLSRRLNQRVTMPDLEALNRAGLTEFSASNPASDPASKVARPEKRREETLLSNVSSLRNRSETTDDARTAAGANAPPPPARSTQSDKQPAATTNSRRPARKVDPYQAAEAMTRNVGIHYPLELYRDELDRFDLTRADRERLEELWDELSPEAF